MIYIIAGLILGVLAGLKLNIAQDTQYAVYTSLCILAIINTIFNILLSEKNSKPNIFKSVMYLVGDLSYAFLIGYIGEQLQLPIYLAAVFAFGNNIYQKIKKLIELITEKNS